MRAFSRTGRNSPPLLHQTYIKTARNPHCRFIAAFFVLRENKGVEVMKRMPMMYIPDDMAQNVQMQMHQRAMTPTMQRQQGMMQTNQPQPSGPDWVRVNAQTQVEQVTVLPGQTCWIMVQSEPVFAVKTADQVGLTHTEYYRFERFDPAQARENAGGVTAESFEQLAQRVSRMEAQLAAAGREDEG